MAQVSLKTTVVEYPFALEWTISEDWLKSFDDFDQNGFLISDTYTVFGDSKITYFLDIFPNGNKDEREGETWIFLNINYENETSIIVESSFSIPSAKWCHHSEDIYGKNATLGLGETCCSTYDFFDPKQKFIVDGKFTVKVEGIIKIEKAESKWETVKNFIDLWNAGFEDFTIVVDKKEIKIHKCVLGLQSAVFAAMFKQENEEIEIPDFTFKIVEKAIKLCYHRDLVPDFDIDEAVQLLKFAEKYAIIDLKENLENFLGNNLSAANVCELVNCAIDENALKLQKKCTIFLMNCFSKKKFIPKMELLDKTFLVNVLNNLSCHECQTL